jgi:hypothetical protein
LFVINSAAVSLKIINTRLTVFLTLWLILTGFKFLDKKTRGQNVWELIVPPVVLQEILRAQEELLQERVGRGTQTEGALTAAASAARDISGRHRALNVRRHNGESQTGTCTDSGKEADCCMGNDYFCSEPVFIILLRSPEPEFLNF